MGAKPAKSRALSPRLRVTALSFGLIVALGGIGLLLVFAAPDVDDNFARFWPLAFVGFPIMGALVLWRQPGNRIGLIMLWIGITAGALPLGTVQRDVTSALAPHGYQPEARPFTPHITLARARDRRGDPAFAGCGAAIDQDLGTSTISALTLYESVSTGRGARYVALATLPFRPVI